jgi:hypothetical protein
MHLLRHFILNEMIVYHDSPGTNIGKTQKSWRVLTDQALLSADIEPRAGHRANGFHRRCEVAGWAVAYVGQAGQPAQVTDGWCSACALGSRTI